MTTKTETVHLTTAVVGRTAPRHLCGAPLGTRMATGYDVDANGPHVFGDGNKRFDVCANCAKMVGPFRRAA